MSLFPWSAFTSPEVAFKTIRVSFSKEFVAIDILPSSAGEIPTTPATKLAVHGGSSLYDNLKHRKFHRSVIKFLNFLKDKEQLATRLQERDSLAVEKSKSSQRRYISQLRKRHNGKFLAEGEPVQKMRAPDAFKL